MEPIIINNIPYRQLYSRQQILAKVDELAASIAHDYQDIAAAPILMFVVTGGIYFGVDLSRALDKMNFRHSVDTIGVQRYRGDEKGGLAQLISAPHAQLGGRDVIVVEDTVDHGASLNFIQKYLQNLQMPPRHIDYCVMLLKTNHEALDFKIRYLSWTVGPEWVVGNGMDSEQHYRGLEDIYVKTS